MKICCKCGDPFDSHVKINGKSKNLQSRKFCLVCSPYGKHNTSKNPVQDPATGKICAKCRIEKPLSEFYSNGKVLHSRCKTCLNEVYLARSRKIKEQAIAYKGGKCVKCGYSKNHAALEFHHQDPSAKEFGISKKHSSSFKTIKKELDKCDLLCKNCHAEVHNPDLTV